MIIKYPIREKAINKASCSHKIREPTPNSKEYIIFKIISTSLIYQYEQDKQCLWSSDSVDIIIQD